MDSLSLRERRNHNAILPISNLPVEILTDIFFLCIAEHFPKKETYEYLECICQVCSRWYAIAAAAPKLWAFVSSDWPLSKFRRAAHLSKDWPLEVEVDGGDMVRFLDIVAPHSRRWISASIELEVNRDHPVLHNIDAPRSKRLQLYNGSNNNNEITIRNASHLQRLSLRYIRINWSSALFAGLQDFTIWGDKSLPSLPNLVLLLYNSPLLEQLDLSGTPSDGDEEALKVSGGGVFEAKQVVQLDLHTPWPYLQRVLNSVQFPSLKLAAFGWRETDDFPITDSDNVRLMTLVAKSTMPFGFDLIANSCEKSLEFNADEITVWATPCEVFHSNPLDNRRGFYKYVENCMEHMRSQSFTLQNIHLTTEWETRNDFISYTSLPYKHVSYYPTSPQRKRYAQFIAALETPAPETNNSRWLFHDLESLWIYFTNEFTPQMSGELEAALRERRSVASEAMQGYNLLPTHLRELSLVGPTKPDDQLLQNLYDATRAGTTIEWIKEEPTRGEHHDFFLHS